MKKVLRGIGKWILRILLGLIGLLLIVILFFTIFKGRITDKALSVVNEKFPGQVELANFRLRPLVHFPDASIQLQEISFMCLMDSTDLPDSIPVMRMDEIYVSVNIVQLLKGNYEVSKVRLGEGEINYIVYGDSVTNVELALGMRFGGETTDKEPKEDSSAISLYLDDLEISNLNLNYEDESGGINMAVEIDELHTGLVFLQEKIRTAMDLQIDLNKVQIQDIILDKPRSLNFITSLEFDLERKKLMLDSTILDLKDAVIELSGNVLLEDIITMDVRFNVKNEGIELLNFLLNGILDMDAIEQIGAGEIELGGELKGSLGEDLPLVTANFRAEDLGFHVKALNQDVTEINFQGVATNGTRSDFSEATISIDFLHASMPDGEINMELKFANLVHPEIDLKTDGNIDLSLVDEVLDIAAIQDMKGELLFSGDLKGNINTSTGEFLDNDIDEDDEIGLNARFNNVSFSLQDNEINDLSGELTIGGRDVLLKRMELTFDGTAFTFGVGLYDVLPNFLGFKTDPSLAFSFFAKEVHLDRLSSDTSLTNMFDEPIRDLSFRLRAKLSHEQFKKVLDGNGIPEAEVTLNGVNVKIPGYAPISRVGMVIKLNDSDVKISDFKGKIGTSSFGLDVAVMNYGAFLEKDTAAPLEVEFQLASENMKARELLTFNDKFKVLPETYEEEQLNDFLLKGKVETKVGELLKDSGLPEFRFTTDDIHWDFKYYPLSFRDFKIDVEHFDTLIRVNTFEGRIGESNIKLNASVANLFDSTKALSGNLSIESELLDINELLNYELMGDEEFEDSIQAETLANVEEGISPPVDSTMALADSQNADSTEEPKKSLGLDTIDIPAFQLNIDIKELRYDDINLYGLLGQIRSIPEKIIYLDQFVVESETGGSIMLDGQFNVISPEAYTLSSTFDIVTLNISDFKMAFTMGDSVFVLDETFTGILDAKGIAEIYFEPSMALDLANSTAAFNLSLKDGSVINFTPLQAAARFTGSKNLNNVKFGEIRNRFTLVDETIYVPIMSINTSLAQLIVEGEQGFDGHFMYLVRIPPALISGTARNVISGQRKKSDGEDDVIETKTGQYVVLTVSDKGVKPGDRREKFDEEE